jgi:hypothetical protein
MNGVAIFVLVLDFLVDALSVSVPLLRHIVILNLFPFGKEIIGEASCRHLSI